MTTQIPRVYRCTFEWDEPTGTDGAGDTVYRRHICARPMHHEGPHRDEELQSEAPNIPPKKIKQKREEA